MTSKNVTTRWEVASYIPITLIYDDTSPEIVSIHIGKYDNPGSAQALEHVARLDKDLLEQLITALYEGTYKVDVARKAEEEAEEEARRQLEIDTPPPNLEVVLAQADEEERRGD